MDQLSVAIITRNEERNLERCLNALQGVADEIVVVDGCFSVQDTFGELLSNEECFKIIKGWLMKQGNLTIASMLTTLRDMMGFAKMSDLAAGGGLMGDVTQKDVAQLNRLLSRVRK